MFKYKVKTKTPMLGNREVDTVFCAHDLTPKDQSYLQFAVNSGYAEILVSEECNCGGTKGDVDVIRKLAEAKKEVADVVAKAKPLLAAAPAGSIQAELKTEIDGAEKALDEAVLEAKKTKS